MIDTYIILTIIIFFFLKNIYIYISLYIYMIYIYICVCVKIWFSHVNHISGWWFGFFSIIYGIILPIDFHIFQRGRSTTNQIYVKFIHIFSMNFSIYFNTCVDIPLIHIFFIYPWWTRPVRPSDIVRWSTSISSSAVAAWNSSRVRRNPWEIHWIYHVKYVDSMKLISLQLPWITWLFSVQQPYFNANSVG